MKIGDSHHWIHNQVTHPSQRHTNSPIINIANRSFPVKGQHKREQVDGRGRIHNSGIAAIFWLRWLVTAEGSNDPHAAISSHNAVTWAGNYNVRSDCAAAAPAWSAADSETVRPPMRCSGSRSSGAFLLLAMIIPETTSNTRNPNRPCQRLRSQAEIRFHQHRIGQRCQQRSKIRKRK